MYIHPHSHPAKVSIIVPTYNCGCYLKETIESVFAQSFNDYELIVVNDGSTDNTEEVVSQYEGRLNYIAQPNRGLPAALNTGLNAARGELIAILDADDIWDPEKLKEQVTFLNDHQNIGLSFTNYITFGASTPSTVWFDPRHSTVGKYSRKQVSEHHFVITEFPPLLQLLTVRAMPKPSSVVLRRECIERVGLFDESLTFIQDTQMWLRIGKYFRFGFTDLCLLRRRVREDSLATIQNDRRYVHEHIRMLEGLEQWIELVPMEKAAVERLLGQYCFAAAYLDFSESLAASSRRQFWRSFILAPRSRTLLYVIATFLPSSMLAGLRLMKHKLVPLKFTKLASSKPTG